MTAASTVNALGWTAVVVLAVVLAVIAVALAEALRRTRAELAASSAGPELKTDGPPDLQRVIDALPLATLIAGSSGAIMTTNAAGAALLEARVETALLGRSVRGALTDAVRGDPVRRIEELFGPPLERYIVRAIPLAGGGAVAVVEDVSQVARTEAVRRDFVANISHELKTPVGAVALLAEMLSDESDLAVVHRFAGRIEAESARLATTVDDLLELTQIEFGLPDGSTDVDLDDVVAEVIERIGSIAGDRSIAVSGPDETTGLIVRGDRRQLGSAIYNLVENAVKYSADEASVHIGLGAPSPDEVVVEVVDTGVGIPGADLERVFERFYRVDRARGRDTGGTGLGLAIVRHVTQNHGGTVEVRSTEGVGTTFTMNLPGESHSGPA